MMKAGEYWIGDLCYILQDRNNFEWLRVCNAWDLARNESGLLHDLGAEFEITDKRGFTFKVASFYTKWGDGSYFDNKGREYGVDSGSIGCFPDFPGLEYSADDGHVIEFDKDFEVGYNNNTGVIKFGHIWIHTHTEEEEEDYDE